MSKGIIQTCMLLIVCAWSYVATAKSNTIAKQLVEYLNIDLAKFILTQSIIPEPFLLKLTTEKRALVEQELHKQKDIYFEQIMAKLTMLTDGKLALAMTQTPNLISEQLDAQLQEFITVLTADAHDIMKVSKIYFPVNNSPQFALDSEYGIDIVFGDGDNESISALSLHVSGKEHHPYFQSNDALQSGLRADLVFVPYYYVVNGYRGMHLFERKTLQHKLIVLDELERMGKSSGVRKIIPLAANYIAVLQDLEDGTQAVSKFNLSPFAREESARYAGKVLQFSESGDQAAVWDGERLLIYGRVSLDFTMPKLVLGMNELDEPLMAQFIAAEEQLVLVVGSAEHGFKLLQIDLQREVVWDVKDLPSRPLQLLSDGSSTYVLTATELLRYDADGSNAYQQKLEHSNPKQIYVYEGSRLIVVYDKYLQILRLTDGGEDFTVYVGGRFRIIDQTVSERYASLLVEPTIHSANLGLSLVQLPIARIIAMFQEDEVLRLAPYAMLDLAYNRTLPLIWNGKAFTLQ